MPNRYIEKILRAQVYDVAKETPLESAHLLSRKWHNEILFKREDLQPVFSFKLRGAYNRIRCIAEYKRVNGVIAASAGNHAQGVALSAQWLGIAATIVMPKTTPAIKVKSVKSLGAKTILHGDSYDEAYKHACKLAKQSDVSFIHPYDDEEVIAGQGTIAMELLRQHTDNVHSIFVPVGGGGLIAGVAAYIKYVRPEIKIIGVEPDDAGCLYAALKANKRVDLGQVGIFADGVAVRKVGKLPFEVAKKYVDEVILVSVDEICAAIRDVFDDTRSIAEPAGALSVAGIKKYVDKYQIEDKCMIAIISGANMNFDRLRHVADRAEVGGQGEAILAVTIPEEKGSFKRFCQAIGKRGVTEFNYRYTDSNDAHIFVGIQLSNGEHEKNILVDALVDQGYPVQDMTENEMAKLHLRHMVGGGGGVVQNEFLLRFEFPERPGALMHFLERIGGRWNISLFHYRNHGSAFGRVLAGIQVPEEEYDDFVVFLKELEYPYVDETDNPAFHLFFRK